MRYKSLTAHPAYLGGVEEYDVYLTSEGNVVARYGDGAKRLMLPISLARQGAQWVARAEKYNRMSYAYFGPKVVRMDKRTGDTIAAMVRCFGPPERKPRVMRGA